MREKLKRLAFAGLANPFRLRRRLDRLAATRAVTILNLHRVAQDDGSDYRPLAPALFEELLQFCSTRFALRTFADLHHPSERPRLILSFDDGYRDFFDHALPLLDRYSIRVNHNIIPACTDAGTPPLNVVAQDFVGRASREAVEALDVPGFGAVTKGSGSKLSHFLKSRPMAEQQRLADHLAPQFRRAEDFRPTAMMTIGQLKEVADRHEIGAHSFEHASMAYETNEYLRRDWQRCRDWFRDRLELDVGIYAFPNGSANEDQVTLLQQEGVRHVVLVGERFSGEGSLHHRFTFDGRSVSEVRVRALGFRAEIPRP